MNTPPALVVFSDLDGTLLDHDTYAWAAAKPALDRLSGLGCPVILTSSKTAAEISNLQIAMGLDNTPAIVENGAGVIGLAPQSSQPSTSYANVRQCLEDLSPQFRNNFRGFGDMTQSELAALTGLSTDAAQRAQMRDFSEPGIWSGSETEKRAFADALNSKGLSAQQGGRFLTVSSGRTKADGMAEVLDHYRPNISLALGDAPNDIAMLEAADYGIIIANPHRPPLPILNGEATGRIIRTTQPGPVGWNNAVCAFLDKHLPMTGSQAHG
jgi:mannosyl-3-phosphoglycerate phosphatase